MLKAKSNKARGPVKLDTSGEPTTNKTANPNRKPVNQARGPQTGNTGTPSKQRTFLEEKSARTSYLGQLADMVSGAFGRRGEGMKPNQPNPDADKTALKSISPDTRTRRGPTRG